MEIELKHTWRARRSAWYIRLYLWVWEGKVEEITFCKLFWAYMFMWLGLPVRCLTATIQGAVWLVATVIGTAAGFLADRLTVEPEEEPEIGPEPQSRKPALASQVARTPIYPEWMRNHEPSVVGAWLSTIVKQKALPRLLPTTQSLLVSIENRGAQLGMWRQRIAYAVVLPARRGIKSILGAVAFGLGCVLAALACTGKVLVGAALWVVDQLARLTPAAEKSLSFALRAALLVTDAAWVLLWPARKSFGWIESYLSKAAMVLAVVIAAASVGAWMVALVIAVGLSLSKPLFLLGAILGAVVLVGICLAFGFGVGYIAERWLAPAIYTEVVRPLWRGTTYTTEAIGEGSVSFAKVMVIGYKAVKSNTCPKVEIEE